jgi:Transglutaminase-like superfamily
MNTAQFYLPTHVFACPTKRYWLFLDLARDKYLCIERSEFDALGPLVYGWSECRQGVAEPPGLNQSDPERLAAELQSTGLICTRQHGSKSYHPVEIPTPTRTLFRLNDSLPFPVTLVPRFLRACVTASYYLKAKPLKATVRRIEERRRTRSRLWNTRPEIMEQLVSSFQTLRPLYPRPYLCMFDSLSLLEFLAYHAVFPSWVFAVTSDPFHAHCWVQQDSLLLNDTIDRVVSYTPIMCV